MAPLAPLPEVASFARPTDADDDAADRVRGRAEAATRADLCEHRAAGQLLIAGLTRDELIEEITSFEHQQFGRPRVDVAAMMIEPLQQTLLDRLTEARVTEAGVVAAYAALVACCARRGDGSPAFRSISEFLTLPRGYRERLLLRYRELPGG